MRSSLRGMLVLAAFVVSPGAAWAAEPDPQGMPEGMEAGQKVRNYVWHDADGWPIRTTTAKTHRQVEGTIRVLPAHPGK